MTNIYELLDSISIKKIEQQNLNDTHYQWISLIRKEHRLDKLLNYKSPDLFKKFHNINLFDLVGNILIFFEIY